MPCPYQTLHYNITLYMSGSDQLLRGPVTTLGGSMVAGEGRLTEEVMLEAGQDTAHEEYAVLVEVQVMGVTPVARNLTAVCQSKHINFILSCFTHV